MGPAHGTVRQTGEAVYRNNCALCHQTNAQGLSGQFPRLSGRVATIAATSAGRQYLIEVVLNGIAGRIVVDGTPIQGVMPSFRSLSDAQIVALLNYVSGLPAGARKADVRFGADAVATSRMQPAVPPTEMRDRRAQLRLENAP